MRIAIIGGTGFVGSYLVDALLADGHQLSLLVRPQSSDKVRHSTTCRIVSGALGQQSAVAELVDQCDALIYNVGILRAAPKQGITFEKIQYEGAVQAVDAASKAGVRRMLLMSANGARPKGTAYQETKFRAEEYARRSGLDVTIFRPSVIFGDPRGTMEFASQLYRDMVAPPLPAIGFYNGLLPARGQFAMSPVHVEDVAQAFAASLTDPSTIAKIYELGGPEALSWQQILERICAASQRNKWIIPMPIGALKIPALLFDWLPAFPVTRDQLTMLAQGNTTDAEALETLIGRSAKPFTSENLSYLKS